VELISVPEIRSATPIVIDERPAGADAPPVGGTLGAPAVGDGLGDGVAAHVPTVMVSLDVETVPPNARACPVHVMTLPMVIPDASMSVPMKVEFAPSVVAAVGVQNTLQADAPPASLTAELATVVRAPFTLKMNVPPPVRVIPAAPMEAALEAAVQYTPGA
jgi:hypothetical protein